MPVDDEVGGGGGQEPPCFAFAAEGEASSLRNLGKPDAELALLSLPENLSDEERIMGRLVESELSVQQLAALEQLPQLLRSFDSQAKRAEIVVKALARIGVCIRDRFCALPSSREALADQLSALIAVLETTEGLEGVFNLLLVFAQSLTSGNYSITKIEDLLALRRIFLLLEEIFDQLKTDHDKDGLAAKVTARVMPQIDPLNSAVVRSQGLHLLSLSIKAGFFKQGRAGHDRQRDLLNKLVSNSQDVEREVRKTMADVLGTTASVLPAEFQETLLPEFLDLLRDEDRDVACAAIRTARNVVPHLSKEALSQLLVPCIVEMICDVRDRTGRDEDPLSAKLRAPSSGRLSVSESSRHFEFVKSVALILGPILWALHDDAEEELMDPSSSFSMLLSQYAALVRTQGSPVRYLCAYNWPGVLQAVGSENFATRLRESFEILALDDCTPIRTCIVRSLHLTLAALGPINCAKFILPKIYPALLCDTSETVRQEVAKHLDLHLEAFEMPNEGQRGMVFRKLLGPIIEFLFPECSETAQVKTLNWRLQRRCIELIPRIARYFAPTDFYLQVMPQLMRQMRDGVEPLRKAATQSCCWLLHNNAHAQQDVRIVHDIKAAFLRSRAWVLRKLFLWFLACVAEDFDTSFFARYRFGDALVDLINDNVSNVRFEACQHASMLVVKGVAPKSSIATALTLVRATDERTDVREAAAAAIVSLEELPDAVAMQNSNSFVVTGSARFRRYGARGPPSGHNASIKYGSMRQNKPKSAAKVTRSAMPSSVPAPKVEQARRPSKPSTSSQASPRVKTHLRQ